MFEYCLTTDFELRGQIYHIWSDGGERTLVDPRTGFVVDTGRGFDPPLTNDELLSIYDYGKDW